MKIALLSSFITTSAQASELQISGFASMTSVKVLNCTGVPHYGIDEPTFLANYPQVSAYNEDWDFEPESLFGLQFKSNLSDGLSSTAHKFYGLATNVTLDNWFLLSEINRLDFDGVNLDSFMLSTGYNFGKFTPYVGYSELEEDINDGENHNTTFAGVRWDFHSSAAFKVQFDKVEDNSYELAVAADSEALTLSVDLVF